MTCSPLCEQERTIRKKLQQIDTLQRRADESPLDSQQQAKLALRPTLLSALQALQVSLKLRKDSSPEARERKA